jgi:hypothetical protein
MKTLITAAAVAASTAATPAVAQFGTMNSTTDADFEMLDEANELALCGVYDGLWGNCSRVAGELGLTVDEVRALADEYWNTAPADRAGFLAELGM